jgi:uncharacterized BrkB/YihY/UPF0761 family membrane protein
MSQNNFIPPISGLKPVPLKSSLLSPPSPLPPIKEQNIQNIQQNVTTYINPNWNITTIILIYLVIMIVILLLFYLIKPTWVQDKDENGDPNGDVSVWKSLLWSLFISFLILGFILLIRWVVKQ